MALSIATGSFLTNTSTGNQAVTGVGFQGKVVIFFGSQKPDSQGEANNSDMFFGVATGASNRWSVSGMCHWGFNPPDNYRDFSSAHCITMADFGNAQQVAADFVSFDSDGFTINITDADASARRIFYIVLGGTDLSAKAGTFDSNSTTGNQAVTGVGFQPEFTLFGNGLVATTEGVGSAMRFCLGAALSSSNRWALSATSLDGVDPTNSASRLVTTACAARVSSTDLTLQQQADFVSNDSDGFTVNWGTTTQVSRWGYLCLRGAQFAMGSSTNGTTTGNKSVTGLSFQPSLVMAFSRSMVASSTIDANLNLMIASATGSSDRRVASVSDPDAIAAPAVAQKKTSEALFMCHITGTGGGGNPNNDAEGDFVSMDSGGFTYNMASTDGVDREFIYLAIAQNAGGGGGFNATRMMGVL